MMIVTEQDDNENRKKKYYNQDEKGGEGRSQVRQTYRAKELFARILSPWK